MNAPKRMTPRGSRRLVLVDIENVAGGGLRTAAMAAWARNVVQEGVAVEPGEQVVVGVSAVDGLFHAKQAWPEARVILGFGHDGADHALLDVLCSESVADRFDQVAIVSGDGIFAEAAAAIGSQGATVTVFAWDECMSKRLRLAAKQVVLLTDSRPSEAAVSA